jgi:ribosomal protein S18 acetylase RimI-like enzyme
MAFFVEYEPDDKKNYDEFYSLYDLIVRRSVFSDYIEVAKITTDRRGEGADHEQNLEFFKQKFELRDEKENEYFIAALKDKNYPDAPEEVIGYSHVEYCDFDSEKYKKYGDINTPSGWYLLGLGVYPKYRRLGIGSKLTDIRLKWARDTGAKKVYFYTNPLNVTSQEFHKVLGFKKMEGEWRFLDRPSSKTVMFEIDL